MFPCSPAIFDKRIGLSAACLTLGKPGVSKTAAILSGGLLQPLFWCLTTPVVPLPHIAPLGLFVGRQCSSFLVPPPQLTPPNFPIFPTSPAPTLWYPRREGTTLRESRVASCGGGQVGGRTIILSNRMAGQTTTWSKCPLWGAVDNSGREYARGAEGSGQLRYGSSWGAEDAAVCGAQGLREAGSCEDGRV